MTSQTLLIGNTRGDNIYQFNVDTGEFIGEFIAPRNNGLADPDTLLYGPDVNGDGLNDLYIASGSKAGNSGEFGASSILVYDGLSGSFIKALVQDDSTTHADETGGLFRPYGIAFGPDGNLYVSSFRSDQILRYNGTTGAFIDVFAQGDGTANGLNGPNGLRFIDNKLFVTTQGSVADGAGGIDFRFNSRFSAMTWRILE
jgi:serralysin